MKNILLFLVLVVFSVQAQYFPQVGFGTNDAVFKDDTLIKSWATNCSVQRGWIDRSNKSLGKASFGLPTDATGKSDGSLVSLGDSGVAILTFANPIRNGVGDDFAIFENGFLYQTAGLAFLELAFVDVSSDGITYFRFPSISNTQTNTQIGSFDYLDATKINNLAGKYIKNYGTPFDLDELKNKPGLDVNNITHVKLTDVTGSISTIYENYDSQNNIINDPFTTAFTTSGFDLEAVAVLNQSVETNLIYSQENETKIYPTVLKSGDKIQIKNNEIEAIKIINMQGQTTDLQVINNEIDVNKFANGIYVLQFEIQNKLYIKRISIE